MGNAASDERDRHEIGLLSGTSTAIVQHQIELKKSSLKAARDEVNAANAKEEWSEPHLPNFSYAVDQ